MGQARPLAAALLPLLLVTAGCIALDASSPARLEAKEAASLGQGVLPADAGDAHLVKMTTLGHPHTADGARADLTLDGQAKTWLLTWWDPANATGWQVLVPAGGQAQATETNRTPYSTDPVTGWSVDSGQALDACIEDDRFAEVAAQPDALVSLDLYADRDGPVWTVMVTSTQENATRILEIDARNGDVRGDGYDDRSP